MVVPLKYLLIPPPFSSHMPSSCCLFTFKHIWLFALTLLVVCVSRNARCRSHPLSHWHQERTGRRAAASVLRECFGRWHVHTQSGCFTSSSRHILLTYLLWLHFTQGEQKYPPCLDSLLYRNPAAAGEWGFPVLIVREHNILTDFTLCPSQTRNPSPNMNLNAINSALGRWKPTCTICLVHSISTYPECQPSTLFPTPL